MRFAKVNDYWRALNSFSSWRLRLERLELKGINGFADDTITIRSSLNFICGPNGVGKTSLLRAVWASLAPSQAHELESTRLRINSGTMGVHLAVGAQQVSRAVDFADEPNGEDPELDFEVFHVDTSSKISELQHHFCKFTNIQDALNGVPILECDQDALETLSYLTQIKFSSARVYVLEESEEERPFFEVSTAYNSYDSRTMGLGELAGFYIWWSLERASDRTLLLLEEPESFLSPACQQALAAILVSYVVRKRACIIATTHSPEMIKQANRNCLHFGYRENGLAKFGEASESLLRTVGIISSIDSILLFEDRSAQSFARLWLRHFNRIIASAIEYVAMEGDGNILRALEVLPRQLKAVQIVGVLDGDMEKNPQHADKPNISFLPGSMPIETLYRNMMETEFDRVAPILQLPSLQHILFRIRAFETHEWFEQFRADAGWSHDQLHLMLFRAWILKEENEAVAKTYFEALLNKLPNKFV
jgi:predicted ATPase